MRGLAHTNIGCWGYFLSSKQKLQQQAEVLLTALPLSKSKQNPQFIKQSEESETKP